MRRARLPGPVADAAAVTAAATVATAPLMALYFQQISLASLPANLAAAPAGAPSRATSRAASGPGSVVVPELPEVETVRRGLEAVVVRKRVAAVEVTGRRTVRRQEPAELVAAALRRHEGERPARRRGRDHR